MKLLLSGILVIIIFSLSHCQTYKEDKLKIFVNEGELDSADCIFEKVLKEDTSTAKTYIMYANLLYNKGRNSILNVSTKHLNQNEKGLVIYDSAGKESGSISEYVSYDTVCIQKAIDILYEALEKYPYRLDIRFGIAHM